MGCIEKIYSVSALVGSDVCNANCAWCAGKYLRSQAREERRDGGKHKCYLRSLESAIKLSARYGGWSLSLTSSGEPTCSPDAVTEALDVYSKCARQGAYFPNVNLFTNGILLGNREFCDKWLSQWRTRGLTSVVVSVYSPDGERQAKAYDVWNYPSFKDIRDNVERYGLGLRTTLLLRKGDVDTVQKYEQAVKVLCNAGYNNVTSWPVGEPNGSRNEWTPSRWELFKIRRWLRQNAVPCHAHEWGGGVFDWHGSILRYTDYVTKHNPKKDFVRQLVVWQDGVTSYEHPMATAWIREGALCMR